MTTSTVGSILYSFFEDYLKCQKGLSTASVRSYRDSIRLFLQFVSHDTKQAISRLNLADLSAERVRRFLNTLEVERDNHVRTRNQRLSALRMFFNYMGIQIPEMLIEAERVGATPMKRVAPPETHFLDRDDITALFASLPTTGRLALRDRTLLLFLYNTGARVQEVADLRVSHLELKPQARVHLHGKGNKWRVCPLWQETVSLLKQLLQSSPTKPDPEHPVFTSQNGQALTRYGIYKLVRRHTAHLKKCGEEPRPHHISPHVFRHYLPFLTMSGKVGKHLCKRGLDAALTRHSPELFRKTKNRRRNEIIRSVDPEPCESRIHLLSFLSGRWASPE